MKTNAAQTLAQKLALPPGPWSARLDPALCLPEPVKRKPSVCSGLPEADSKPPFLRFVFGKVGAALPGFKLEHS